MSKSPDECPEAPFHGKPFRYCPRCDWIEPAQKCKHCGVKVVHGPGAWYHELGEGSLMVRCDPKKSGQPYGLNAEPV
ncbi:hypothetical protein [Pseudarthrobacter sp. CCNWLW207]|uniref:hypothetical protein n=1 Tax=Pseudarthrobacter sp. CCNWLW207 TaxID=3127468 RepID=UPI003077A4CE